MSFTETAARLAGLAGAIAGWRPDHFWAATPSELETVLAALAGAVSRAAPPPDGATIAQLKERFPDG